MSFSAGCLATQTPDGQIPVLAFYPSTAAESPERFYPYTMDVARDGARAAGTWPLVVISHGTGSSQFVLRNLAMQLARHGFVVAALEHPRNNRNNNELAGTAEILEQRPRDVRQVIDWARQEFDISAVAVVGHSLGGYTALAVAGGRPSAFAHECADRQARPIAAAPDERVQALVLLAPAAAWFLAPGALSSVQVPILMLTAEHDPHTPAWHGEVIRRGVASAVEHRVVAGAGHFSFLSQFPPAMVNPTFAPSQDPPGFDREAFQAEMNQEILGFLRRVLRGETEHGRGHPAT